MGWRIEIGRALKRAIGRKLEGPMCPEQCKYWCILVCSLVFSFGRKAFFFLTCLGPFWGHFGTIVLPIRRSRNRCHKRSKNTAASICEEMQAFGFAGPKNSHPRRRSGHQRSESTLTRAARARWRIYKPRGVRFWLRKPQQGSYFSCASISL